MLFFFFFLFFKLALNSRVLRGRGGRGWARSHGLAGSIRLELVDGALTSGSRLSLASLFGITVGAQSIFPGSLSTGHGSKKLCVVFWVAFFAEVMVRQLLFNNGQTHADIVLPDFAFIARYILCKEALVPCGSANTADYFVVAAIVVTVIVVSAAALAIFLRLGFGFGRFFGRFLAASIDRGVVIVVVVGSGRSGGRGSSSSSGRLLGFGRFITRIQVLVLTLGRTTRASRFVC